jgi:thiamine biosynthesis lipoprotein
MKETRLIMDMPVIIHIPGSVNPDIMQRLFDYFHYIDNTFSTFKKTSEITKMNDGFLTDAGFSKDMKEILRLAEKTKRETSGYFDIHRGDHVDPSGIVKGWAIHNAAGMLRKANISNYYVEAGGDIEVHGNNTEGRPWTIGIRNPFSANVIVKKIMLRNRGIATSGTYERGMHIYNPKNNMPITEIISLTVIGPNVYEADRFATAAFAMGKQGIQFIEQLHGFEGYMIDTTGTATLTSGFNSYVT